MGKKVIISVISDLATDQRVNRSAQTLHSNGWEVLLIGRQLPNSPEMDQRPYKVKRFRLWFNSGVLFYLNYNLRLFWHLLTHSFDVAFSNDLDTLPANFIASRLKNKILVYDSHEYFTGVPELVNRKFKRSIWRFAERLLVPSIKYLFTVNKSIAELYKNELNVDFKVMRNVPDVHSLQLEDKMIFRIKNELPVDKFIYIIQGSGINIQRGSEEAVEAMQFLDAVLLIVGSGDVIDLLKEKVKVLSLEEKVIFRPRMPYAEMMQYTYASDAGLSLDKDTNINYRFSLPNKLFDYIHAGIPVLVSDLTEIRNIVDGYNIGLITDTHEPKQLANWMNKMQDAELIYVWKLGLKKAAKDLNWHKEKEVLLSTFRNFE